MKGSARARLQKRFKALLESMVEEATSGDPRELEARHKRLEIYRELLEQLPVPWYRRLLLPLVIAMLSIVGAGFAWTIRKTPTRIVLTSEVSGVRMDLKAPLKDALPERGRATGQLLSVSGSEALRAETGLPLAGASSAGTLHLCQGQFILEGLQVVPAAPDADAGDGRPAVSSVEVQLHQAGLPRWFIWRSTLTLGLGLWGPVLLSRERCKENASAGGVEVIDKPLAESLELAATGSPRNPTQLDFSLDAGSELVFRDLEVKGLAFVREVPGEPGTHTVVSTVRRAELFLADSGQTVVLPEGARLRLLEFNGRVSELRIGGTMLLRAEGRASGVWVGPEDFAQELTPTYLEYFYNARQRELLWGAAAFVWGVLWSVKRWLGG
ncbi:hypothetical protein [Pyxidicoccus sp. MSG2]|uniref:hypothetical protein n=1 Tax=Pyxidicoccus sp. MSG2 TaxID=2996790 RepID=UPI00226DDF32|nr:hypothetical protein [Pyxidicoccus sp. MSG2]MCY1019902.1 hypothetical protein [Pyxidicoccus sp. MSG2]